MLSDVKAKDFANISNNFTDVTFIVEDGQLVIERRKVTLTSANDEKPYDGTALTNDTVTVGGDGFASGEGATYDVTGSQTVVGKSDNNFTYKLNAGTDDNNYDIEQKTGTLEVIPNATEVIVKIAGHTGGEKYNGTAQKVTGYDVDINNPLYTEDDFEVNENILLNLTSDLDVVFLCSPNNPTGKKIPKNLLMQILEKCVKFRIRLILDECFYEFLENPKESTMQAEVKNYSQLIILRAFTKMHAIPGLRLGYILCSDNSLLERIQRVRQPWSVSTVAQAAGLAAIEDEERVEKTRQYITKERKRMELELESIGISYIQSDANYILIYYEGKESLYEKLLEKNILIRDCQNYIGLKKGYYRIAIKRKEENDRLLTALREEVEKWQNLL